MTADEDPQAPYSAEELTRFIEAFNRTAGRAITEWFERMRPAFERLTEIANRPEVRAAIERAQSMPRPKPCHCLCGKAHPDDEGVCDGNAVTTRRYVTERLGAVDVPLCAPCLAAQGLAELADGRRDH